MLKFDDSVKVKKMTPYSWGKSFRLNRIFKERNPCIILALDHPLTQGPILGTENIQEWITFSAKEGINGVVLNKGIVPYLQFHHSTSLILQMFGAPDRFKIGYNKVKTASLNDAICLSADAVSVQVTLFNKESMDKLETIQNVVSDASSNDIPILFMVNIPNDHSLTIKDFLFAYRVCWELGADIIKIPLPQDINVNTDFSGIQNGTCQHE